MLVTVLSLIVVLGVLVFVHEAGHFIAAKWAGIYVHRFSLGLGPPIPWLTFRRGETEYSISWLPLGGYVKMASREEDIGSSALEGGAPAAVVPPNRVFEAQPLWQRMVVILAGVTMNALFAWAVFSFLAYKNGRQIDPVTTVGRVVTEGLPQDADALKQIAPGSKITRVNGDSVTSWDDIVDGIANTSAPEVRIDLDREQSVVLPIHPDALEERLKAAHALQPFRAPVIGEVLPDKPAARAGIRKGDSVVAVNGRQVGQWYDLLEVVQSSAGQNLAITVSRNGERQEVQLRPYTDTVPGPDGKPKAIGRVGVAVRNDLISEKLDLTQALREGGRATAGASTQVLRTVRGLFSGRISGRNVGGPILIGQLAGESARMGLDTFLGFMALISINLAILNLLPVPVLDGGQFLFLLAEGVIRRPLPLKLRERLTTVGLVLIILLMGLAFSNDFRRLFGG
ncbi:MAG TPA: RIP metalloprotease RseP [Gemmatimonadales bacterium]|nr:RIP metalloprotease RseP [Gemmatimonadales bacterium]